MSQITTPQPAPPHDATAEQVGRQQITEELRQLRLHTIVTIQPDIEDESDEEPIDIDDAPEAEEEEDEKENLPPPAAWSKQCNNVACPPLTIPSGLQLPVHHAVTEMDFFQCMLTQQTIHTIAANSTAYARSKGANPAWTTSAEEL
jgi:hypothetical protein